MKKLTRQQRIAAADKAVRDSIAAYGCHIYSVVDPDGNQPSFTYSVGIQQSCGAPEIIVFGLPPEISGFMINEYNRRAQKGRPFESGKRYRGFLKGFTVFVEPVSTRRAKDYMLGDHRLYGNWKFKVAQIVWPTTAGVWPWEPGASDSFRKIQPLLCSSPIDSAANQCGRRAPRLIRRRARG